MRFSPAHELESQVLVCRLTEDPDSRINETLPAAEQIVFTHSVLENTHAVLKRFHRNMPPGPGALVSNSNIELACYSRFRPDRTLFQIVHDQYNLELSLKYEPIIDVMIAHSQFFYQELIKAFPWRADSIFYRPYGICLAPQVRTPQPGPLRLVFLGRLHQMKGVHDLPEIDRLITEAGVEANWTIIGNGPEREPLHKAWPPSDRIRYASPTSNADVLELCQNGDLFVFPTRFEGFPVALLEAMSAGLVPVVTDLPSGIPEVVTPDSGVRVPVGDCRAFSAAITALAHDSARLEAMSVQARKQAERFRIEDRIKGYTGLFCEWEKRKRPWPGPLPLKHGSRLDKPWMPNRMTTTVRKLRRLLYS
jgi:glycosyltransferase involved in cell wall biosynthesis